MNSEVTNGRAAAMQAQPSRDSEQTGAQQADHPAHTAVDPHSGQTQLDLELEPLAGRNAAQDVQRPVDHADSWVDDVLSVPVSGAKSRLLSLRRRAFAQRFAVTIGAWHRACRRGHGARRPGQAHRCR